MLPIDCFVTTHEKVCSLERYALIDIADEWQGYLQNANRAIWIDILHLFSYMPNWPQSVVCKMFKSLISEGIK